MVSNTNRFFFVFNTFLTVPYYLKRNSVITIALPAVYTERHVVETDPLASHDRELQRQSEYTSIRGSQDGKKAKL